jgi:hypothetical protein
MKLPVRLAVAVLVATTVPAVAATSAHAGSAGEEIRRGSCSESADWKMKAKPDDGRIEVEAEIDSNRNGQTWRWVLKHNGNTVDRGTSTTTGPSGSFDVERRTNNASGTDSFRFRAVDGASGQVCVARVRL